MAGTPADDREGPRNLRLGQRSTELPITIVTFIARDFVAQPSLPQAPKVLPTKTQTQRDR